MTKKVLKGIVTSAKNNKTIVVEVTRKFKHPFYEKVIKRSKKYHAHDEKNKFKEGDILWFLTSKSFGGKIIGMSEYTCYYDRDSEKVSR